MKCIRCGIAIALAVSAVLLLGSVNFAAGVLAERTGDWREMVGMAFLALTAATVFMAVLIPVLPAGSPRSSDWALGALAGAATGITRPTLYYGLSLGAMTVFAPIAALFAISMPVRCRRGPVRRESR